MSRSDALSTSGDLSRDGCVEKNRELDGMIETLNARSKELADRTVLLRKAGTIETAIAQYCEGARVRFNKCCSDPSSMRAFMLHYVEKVVHLNGKVSLHGRVPVRYEQGDDIETNTLPFCIESQITREERYLEKMRNRRGHALSAVHGAAAGARRERPATNAIILELAYDISQRAHNLSVRCQPLSPFR